MSADGSGTKDDPWQLKTPPLTSEYVMVSSYATEASLLPHGPPTDVGDLPLPQDRPGVAPRRTMWLRLWRMLLRAGARALASATRSPAHSLATRTSR